MTAFLDPAAADEPQAESGEAMTFDDSHQWVRMLIIDFVLVLLFAVAGMFSHHESFSILHYVRVASPFVLAFAVAVLLTTYWRCAHSLFPAGVLIVLITAGGGIIIRHLFGDGIAFPFQVVTFSVLAVLLLGRRLLSKRLLERKISA